MNRWSERGRHVLVCFGIIIVLYLFYKSFLVLILLLPCMAVYRRICREDREQKRKDRLHAQFKDLLDSMAASLRAGYSVENALHESVREMAVLHGEDSPICQELRIMENQLQVGVRMQEAWEELAQRSTIENMITFSSVFGIAKQSGGNMAAIMEKTAQDIAAQIDAENEIAVLISAKKLEHTIMTMIPAGMILYIDLTSDGLLDPLYGNLTGATVMTVCLLVYGAAIWMGRKIMRIEV